MLGHFSARPLNMTAMRQDVGNCSLVDSFEVGALVVHLLAWPGSHESMACVDCFEAVPGCGCGGMAEQDKQLTGGQLRGECGSSGLGEGIAVQCG